MRVPGAVAGRVWARCAAILGHGGADCDGLQWQQLDRHRLHRHECAQLPQRPRQRCGYVSRTCHLMQHLRTALPEIIPTESMFLFSPGCELESCQQTLIIIRIIITMRALVRDATVQWSMIG